MTEYLTVDGLRLAYRVDGPAAAPALVFSNSLGTDWRMWDAQAAALAGRFRVVRYDTRGHGQSPDGAEHDEGEHRVPAGRREVRPHRRGAADAESLAHG